MKSLILSFALAAALVQAPPTGQPQTVDAEPGKTMVVDIPDRLSDYTINRMIEFVQQIEVELRGQYALSYYSTTPGPSAGKTIRVRAGSPDNRVQVRREAIEKPTGKK